MYESGADGLKESLAEILCRDARGRHRIGLDRALVNYAVCRGLGKVNNLAYMTCSDTRLANTTSVN